MGDWNFKSLVGKMVRWAVVALLSMALFIVSAYAEGPVLVFKTASLQGVLQEISAKYHVVIVADPSLAGPVPKKINSGTVESALWAILEPLGYSYTKVEDYYLVSGPKSPLTLLAETESSVVPVGFLDRQTREKLGNVQKYLTYDEARGIAYVKAPSSKMNQILAKLWEVSRTSAELSVVYQIQIIDLGTTSGLDFMFSGKYDSSSTENGIVITPDQWASDGTTQAILKAQAEANTDNLTRRPWLIALPGKTAELNTSLYYRGAGFQYERLFKVAVTPVKLDPDSGRVVSNIFITRDLTNQTNQTSSSNQTTPVLIAEKTNRVSTTVETEPGAREILAVIRQTDERFHQSAVFLPFIGRRKVTEHRDFILLLTAAPVNIQSTLASANGIIPVASLGGFDTMEGLPQPPIERKSSLELGLGLEDPEGSFSPGLGIHWALGENTGFQLSYQTDDLYSLGFLYDFDAWTSLELTAGKGIGPQGEDAAMVGLVDRKNPIQYVELFGKYYPLAYLFNTKELTWEGVWEAGTRLGTPKFGLSVSAFGDSGYDGCRYQLDYSPDKITWILKYSLIEKEPDYLLGIRFNF